MKWTSSLTVFGLLLIFFGLLLYVPSWGGSIIIIVFGLVFLFTSLLIKRRSLRTHNLVSLVYIVMLTAYFFVVSRTLTFTSDRMITTDVYVVCGVVGAERLTSTIVWNAKVVIPEDQIILTSSELNELPKHFDVITNGRHVLNGITYDIHECEAKQFKLLILNIGSPPKTKEEAIEEMKQSTNKYLDLQAKLNKKICGPTAANTSYLQLRAFAVN